MKQEAISAQLADDWADYGFSVRMAPRCDEWEAGWFGCSDVPDILATGKNIREAVQAAVDRLQDADARSARTD